MEANTTDAVWQLLGNIPVGTIVVWITVAAAIIGAICGATIKLYKVFLKYQNVKNENKKQAETIAQHEEMLQKISESLVKIENSLEQQKEVNLKQIRYSIVHTCDEALESGFITAGKFKSMLEMYEEYTEIFHGNGYVKTLVKKTEKLPISGKLDE